MKPAAFEYFRPADLTEAVRLLDELGEEARILSGGQSLVPMMNLRLATPAYLIDLSGIPGLAGIAKDAGFVRIGAMTLQRELLAGHPAFECMPLVPLAAACIGHVQTRSRGTLGGSLANADPAAELPLVMVTLDATVVVSSTGGERRIRARDFFLDTMTTAIEPNEIITGVLIPCPARRPTAAFREFARRHGDFALASVALQRCAESGTISVGIGAVATRPLYCRRLGMLLADNAATREDITAALDEDLSDSALLDDDAGSAGYRKSLAVELLLECLSEISRQ